MSLRVLEPGPYSLLVDLGRPRHRSFGVPVGGAADRAALVQGNALVGNATNATAIEFAMAGPTLRIDAELGCVITGAPFDAWIDDQLIQAGTTFNLKPGEKLRIGSTSIGARGYLCIANGIQAIPVLGSCTGFQPLQRHDVLTTLSSHVATRSLVQPVAHHFQLTEKVLLRCLCGTQADWFDVDSFLAGTYTVSPQCDRMGLRLTGTPLTHKASEMVSEPVCPGSVQVVNDGQCIILGVDGQTIGGYPKIAQVISADLDRLAQLRPGQIVEFQIVSMEVAEAGFLEYQTRININLMRLQIAGM